MDKKKIIISIIIITGGFVLLSLYNSGFVTFVTAERGASSQKDAGNITIPMIKTGLMKGKTSDYEDVKRAIFSPLVEEKPHAPVHVVMPAILPEPTQPSIPLSPPQVIPATPPPPPAPTEVEIFASQAKFLGSLEGNGTRTIFITKGTDVLTVRKGDTLKERFKVVSLTEKEMLLKDSSTGEEARVFLIMP